MHKVDPYIWLVDVLQRIATHPARDVAQLTPRLWKEHFAANPLTSDIEKASWNPHSNSQPELHKSTPTPGNIPK